MDNETKLSSEQIDSIMKEASEGKIDSERLIREHLSEGQAQKLRTILNDPEKLRSIMESPLAKKIMEAVSGKKE